MIKTQLIRVIATIMIAGLCFVAYACSGSNGASEPSGYADGSYIGRSSDFQSDESGNGAGYGQVELEIKDNEIISCTFTLYELDGKIKDETYGADLSKENRLKAQKAVQSASKYAQMLVESGSIEGVDAISGVTISHSEFIEAVNDALSKAAE